MTASIQPSTAAGVQYLLRLGDACLVLSHRLSEWCGHGPILEEDIAMSNIALDLIGHASSLLALAGTVEGRGRDEDALAYFREGVELFTPVSWLQVLHGQGLKPKSYHPLVDVYPEKDIQEFLDGIATVIGKCVDVMPTHADYIAQHCAAPKM